MINPQGTLCISPDELGRQLGISRPTAYNLAHTEGFPAFRVGTRILIPLAQLEEWLGEQSGYNGKVGA